MKIVCFIVFAVILAGCTASDNLTKGIAEKSLGGSGTVSDQRIGIDPETKTPVLKSLVITGDYTSARDGQTSIQYRRRKSPSIFNSEAVTEEVTINFIGSQEKKLDETNRISSTNRTGTIFSVNLASLPSKLSVDLM